jgi:hypothetical protein
MEARTRSDCFQKSLPKKFLRAGIIKVTHCLEWRQVPINFLVNTGEG